MKGEKHCGGEGNFAAACQALNQLKHKVSHGNVAEDRREVPPFGTNSKHCVIQAEPEKKERAIIVTPHVGIQFPPNVSGEVVGQVVPRMNRGVLNDLWLVVVYELKSERGDVYKKGKGAGNRFSHAAP